MQQLTIRGFESELERALRATARANGTSLNKAALDPIRRAAGLHSDTSDANAIGDGLDRYIGSWSAADEREVLDAVRTLDVVDDELWR